MKHTHGVNTYDEDDCPICDEVMRRDTEAAIYRLCDDEDRGRTRGGTKGERPCK